MGDFKVGDILVHSCFDVSPNAYGMVLIIGCYFSNGLTQNYGIEKLEGDEIREVYGSKECFDNTWVKIGEI
jgi:hypothetical protein